MIKGLNVIFRKALVLMVSILCAISFLYFNADCSKAEKKVGVPATPAAPDAPILQICKQKKISYPLKSPRMVVDKTARTIEVYSGDVLVKTFPVAFGWKPTGAKEYLGDGRTPEGEYYLIKHTSPGFGRCFYIAYPNDKDARRGLNSGLINRSQYNAIVKNTRRFTYPPSNTRLGGLILLHGTKDRSTSNVTATDWTIGCIAMENAHIMELLDAIKDSARPRITIVAGK